MSGQKIFSGILLFSLFIGASFILASRTLAATPTSSNVLVNMDFSKISDLSGLQSVRLDGSTDYTVLDGSICGALASGNSCYNAGITNNGINLGAPILSNTSTWTIAFDAYMPITSTTTYTSFVSQYSPGSTGRFFVGRSPVGPSYGFRVGSTERRSSALSTSSTYFSGQSDYDTWRHWVISRSGTSYVFTVDGVQVIATTTNSTFQTTTNTRVGLISTSQDPGYVDNLRIFNGTYTYNEARSYIDSAASISASATTTGANINNLSITLTGVGTTWTAGTPGSPTFTASTTGTGASIVSQSITDSTHATVVINTGTPGIITITDPGNATGASITVPSFTISADTVLINQGATGTSIQITGTNTSFTGSPFTLTNVGSTAASIASQSVTDSTHATVVIDSGSAPGSFILTDTLSSATTTVNIISALVNDSHLFFSPYNWYVNGDDYAQTSTPGAYLKTGFTGTSITLELDQTAMSAAATSGDFPMVRWKIDGGAWSADTQIPASGNLSLATGLTSGNHTLYFVLINMNESVNRWNTPTTSNGSLRIRGFTLDESASLLDPSGSIAIRPKRMIVYGDSISIGKLTIGNTGNDLTSNDATLAWWNPVAEHLDAEVGVVAYRSQGWRTTGLGNIPTFYTPGSDSSITWDKYDASHSRLVSSNYSPVPDYVFENMGVNDENQGISGSLVSAAAAGWLEDTREAVGPTTKIYMVMPFVETGHGYVSHIEGTIDEDFTTHFIDLGSAFASTITDSYTPYDTLHPDAAGQALIGSAINDALDAFVVDSAEITGMDTSVTDNSAVLTWNTTTPSSSRIFFGPTSTYSSSTPETNTSSRTLSHSVTLTELPSCALFHYVVTGRNAALATATSSSSTFATTGCTGDASISESQEASVLSASGGSLMGSSLTLTIPALFTATSSAATFQILELIPTSFFSEAGTPSSDLENVGNTVYGLRALINSTSLLSSFDEPLSLTFSYISSEVEDIDESSLQIYRYDGSQWNPLPNCSVNTTNRTVTCETSNFSEFALFGEPSSSNTSHSGPGTSITSQVRNLIKLGNNAKAEELKKEWPNLFPPATSTFSFMRDLTLGSSGDDVRVLQVFLNSHNSVLVTSGAGSPGNETTFFGPLTRAALAAYQVAAGIVPSIGYFGPITRAYVLSLP